MRTFFLTLLVAALTTASLSAQHFGARVGVNSTNAKFKGDGVDLSFDSQINLMLGAFVDLPIGGGALMLSPELSYVGRGYNVDFGGGDIKTNLSYLDLGALLKYMVTDNGNLGFYLAGGPVFGYALSGKVDDDKIEFDDNDGFNRLNVQLALAGGLTFAQQFFVEVRYQTSITDLADDEGADVSSRWNSIGLNGGIRIPLGN